MSLVNFIWRLDLDSGNQTRLENILHNLYWYGVKDMLQILFLLQTKEYKGYIICNLAKNCYVIHKLFLFTRNWHTRNKISEDFQDIYIMKNTLFYINGLKVFTCTSLEITLSKHFDQLNFLELHSCINLWHPINATSHIRNFTV